MRIGVAALPPVAATMPWVPLLAGCLAGLAVSVAGRMFASPSDHNLATVLLTCRVAFAPVVAGQAFLLADPQRPVSACLPAPAWLPSAIRVLLAAPVIAATAAAQLILAAVSQRVLLQARQPSLPWVSLGAELAAWSAVALAAGAILGRTRWHDVGGALTVPLALAAVAVLGQLPWQLFPVGLGNQAASTAWTQAGLLWSLVCVASLAGAAWSSRDSWNRASRYLPRSPRYPADGITEGEAA
jgi:hypothetical protein